MLPASRWGEGPTVGLVHGFTQSGASWQPVATRLAGRWHVVAPDAPGHGQAAGVVADLWDAADKIGETVGPGVYVGYSMGGRMVLHLALLHPEIVTGLVLVSATAGLEDPEERAGRRAADERLAQEVAAGGVEAFVTSWLSRPLFATLEPQDAALEARLGGTAAGLASSLRHAGLGTQEPLWDRLGALEMPVLVVAGDLDAVYAALAARLAAAIGPTSTVELIGGAGHACHLERPAEFAELLAGWMTAVTDR